MQNSGKVLIGELVVGSTDWTPLIAPIDCDAYAIVNTANLWLCSDTNGPKLLGVAGSLPSLALPASKRDSIGSRTARFSQGDIIIFLKSVENDPQLQDGQQTISLVFVS